MNASKKSPEFTEFQFATEPSIEVKFFANMHLTVLVKAGKEKTDISNSCPEAAIPEKINSASLALPFIR